MKSFASMLGCILVLLGGCATTNSDSEHVLSGEAPVESVIRKADHAALAGDAHAASILYQQALRRDPQPDVWYRFGVTLEKLGQSEQALWAYRNALELEAAHVESLQAVGFYFTTRDRPEEALPFLERLVAEAPTNWRAHNALGVVADLESRFDDAIEHYRTALELNPESPMLWNNLGFSHYLAGDYSTAARHIVKALQIDPDYQNARHNIALVFARQSKYEEALQVMLRSGDEAQAYCDVGYLAFKMGDYETAETLLTEAIRRSATYYRQAHENLAAVRNARSEASRG